MLVISNRPCTSRSSDFEITSAITPWIVLNSIQLLLQIVNYSIHLLLESVPRFTFDQSVRELLLEMYIWGKYEIDRMVLAWPY